MRYPVLLLVAAATISIGASPLGPQALSPTERNRYYSAGSDHWADLDNLDPLPGWAYKPMVKGLLPYIRRDGVVKKLEVRLLAWSIQEDSRPLLVDSALLWATFESKSKRKWALSHQFRHPRAYPGWMDATPTDVEWSDTVVLDRRPTNADIYALVDTGPHQPSFFRPLGDDFVVHMAHKVPRDSLPVDV